MLTVLGGMLLLGVVRDGPAGALIALVLALGTCRFWPAGLRVSPGTAGTGLAGLLPVADLMAVTRGAGRPCGLCRPPYRWGNAASTADGLSRRQDPGRRHRRAGAAHHRMHRHDLRLAAAGPAVASLQPCVPAYLLLAVATGTLLLDPRLRAAGIEAAVASTGRRWEYCWVRGPRKRSNWRRRGAPSQRLTAAAATGLARLPAFACSMPRTPKPTTCCTRWATASRASTRTSCATSSEAPPSALPILLIVAFAIVSEALPAFLQRRSQLVGRAAAPCSAP